MRVLNTEKRSIHAHTGGRIFNFRWFTRSRPCLRSISPMHQAMLYFQPSCGQSFCVQLVNFPYITIAKCIWLFRKKKTIFNIARLLPFQHEADQQHHWRIAHKDRITKLKEKLHKAEDELQKGMVLVPYYWWVQFHKLQINDAPPPPLLPGKEELINKRQIQEAQSHSLAIAKAQVLALFNESMNFYWVLCEVLTQIVDLQLAKRQVEQLGQHQPDLVRAHSLHLVRF